MFEPKISIFIKRGSFGFDFLAQMCYNTQSVMDRFFTN